MSCPEDDISATYISADLIRYLQTSVIAFITDVIHRAVVWKEQDNELKGQKKVWRGALDQVVVFRSHYPVNSPVSFPSDKPGGD